MGISSTLFTGASGLATHGEAISVVGDNIANISTVGFKAQRAGFDDVLGGQASSGTVRIGGGVRLGGIYTQFQQGSFLTTGNSLDLAISGTGFFVVHEPTTAEEVYTRDGRFQLNNIGHLVNVDGYAVQGYTIDAFGKLSTAPADLVLAGALTEPAATANVSITANLDSSSVANPGVGAFDATNSTTANNTSSASTSMQVFDSLGNEHRVDLYFRKTADSPAQWEWHALVDAAQTEPAGSTGPLEIGTGQLGFDGEGKLQDEANTPVAVTFIGANPQSVNFDFGDELNATPAGTGLRGTTQFKAPFGVSVINQDGYASGTLLSVTVAEDGTVIGQFSNGSERGVARLAMARFQSDEGLERAGNSRFRQTPRSGRPLVAPAGTAGRGTVVAGHLEGSNVDLGNELVTLIAYQRAFSANARTVTTIDELLSEVSNMKR